MASHFPKTLIIACLAPAMIGAAHAATINASSCALSAVQTAVTSASAGDTVSVPAGNCTWSGALSLPENKRITLKGAGKTSTVVSGSLNFGRSGSRVTGFGFTGNPTIYSEGYGFRLDNSKINRSSWGEGVQVRNTMNTSPIPVAHGLIDHNELVNGRVNAEGTNAMFSDGSQQHVLWTATLDLGGPTAIYVEDNTFTNTVGTNPCNFLDGNYGGRYVARYNTITGCVMEAHSSQEGGNRGIRSWEIYGNDIGNTGAAVYYPYRIRAGTGVIFYNRLSGNWQNSAIAFDNVRSYAPAGQGGGMCNGSSAWDGNKDQSGYPCRDQIGRSNDNPQWTHQPAGAYTQPLVPAYVWLNKTQSNAELPVNVINGSQNHIKPNRDYYTLTSSFNGSSAMGCGTLAARPATCTVGVGYWATNQSCSDFSGMTGAGHSATIDGTLYRCTAANTWTAHYKPYTYPHPLAGGSSPAGFQAPPNLRIVN
jgi:hypothetical protein